MNLLRKLLLMIIVFLGAVLWTPPSYSTQAECSYCLQNECLYRCSRKRNTDQMFFNSNDYPQGNHFHCISYQDLNTKEILFLWIDLEEEKTLALGQDISEEKVSLSKEDKIPYLNNKSTSKFISLFLLKSSFLL